MRAERSGCRVVGGLHGVQHVQSGGRARVGFLGGVEVVLFEGQSFIPQVQQMLSGKCSLHFDVLLNLLPFHFQSFPNMTSRVTLGTRSYEAHLRYDT